MQSTAPPSAVGLLIEAADQKVYLTADTEFDEQLFTTSVEGANAVLICINGRMGNMSWQEGPRDRPASNARTILHGCSLADAEESCCRVRKDSPSADVHTVNFSLGDMASINAAFANLKSRGLMPDILVNNAAHLGLGDDTSFLGQTPEFFGEVISANLLGTMRCSQLAAAHLRDENRGGSIISITSLGGDRRKLAHQDG